MNLRENISRKIKTFNESFRFGLVDAGAAALGLLAGSIMLNPNLRDEVAGPTIQFIADKALDLLLIGYVGLKTMYGVEKMNDAKKNRIQNGTESLQSKGETIFVLGGTGHPTVTDLFNGEVFNILPAFDNAMVARSLDTLTRPSYINLDLMDATVNMFTTDRFALAQVRDENLFHQYLSSISLDRIPVFTTFAFGETIATSVSHQGGSSISLARQEAGHTAWNKAVVAMLEDDQFTPRSIMVRFGDAHMPVLTNTNEKVVLRDLMRHEEADWIQYGSSDGNSRRYGFSFTGLKKVTENGVESVYGIRTSIPGLNRIPFLKAFGLRDIDSSNGPTPIQSKPVILVVESGDEETIATALRRRAKFRGKDDAVLLLETVEAAEVAGSMGFERVICMTDLHQEMVTRIVGLIKKGESAMSIQQLIDKELHAQECRNEVQELG